MIDTSRDAVEQVAHEYTLRGAYATAELLRALLAERDALRKDAERYRYLRRSIAEIAFGKEQRR